MAPVHAHIEHRSVSSRGPTSPMTLVYGFVVVAIVGAVLLELPISNVSHHFISPITAIFTSVSAITGTGLVVVDTGETFTGFGKLVIAALIFIGGLGFMTGAAFLLLVTRRRSSLQGRLVMRAGLDDNRIGSIGNLARNIVLMAVVVQLIGSVLLFARWYIVDQLWTGISLSEGVYQSLFTAISAFNNAGFDVLPDDRVGGASLMGLSSDIPTLLIIAMVILVGATGYTTVANTVSVRRWRRLTLDTKLVLMGGFIMLLIGFGAFAAFEWSNPATIGQDTVSSKLMQSAFHTVNRSAGFSTLNYSDLNPADLTVTEGLMFVGGAPASTTAGIKVSTVMVILIASIAVFRGSTKTTVFGRTIPVLNVRRAMVVGSTAAGAVVLLVIALFAVQPTLDFRAGMFELISAFGNTGWSTGVTSQLSAAALGVVTVAMVVGRFGPLTIALLMIGKEHQGSIELPQERVRIG